MLLKNASGTVLAELTAAGGFVARMKGLLGTGALRNGAGLLLKGRQVHTIGMRYPIDVIYLDRGGTVLKVRGLAPWRLGPLVPRARWIVELGLGTAGRFGIREGDVLRFEEEAA